MVSQFSVFIKCMTYNQSAYIEDAMNGFVMQKTFFPYICVIVDDASSDDEPKIINKYFQKYFNLIELEENDDCVLNYGQHKTNKNCFFAIIYLKYNHYSIKKNKEPYYSKWQNQSKFIALCEGDDYWIDENKIQRQVDFLEKNEDCSLTSENGLVLYVTSGETKPFSNEDVSYYSIDDLLLRRRFPTASVMYRAIYADELSKNKCALDTVVWAYLSLKGKIHYDNHILSTVYRKGVGVTASDNVRWAYTSEDFNNRINKMFNPIARVRIVRRKMMLIVYTRGILDAIKRGLWRDSIKLSCHLFICFFLFLKDTACCFFSRVFRLEI